VVYPLAIGYGSLSPNLQPCGPLLPRAVPQVEVQEFQVSIRKGSRGHIALANELQHLPPGQRRRNCFHELWLIGTLNENVPKGHEDGEGPDVAPPVVLVGTGCPQLDQAILPGGLDAGTPVGVKARYSFINPGPSLSESRLRIPFPLFQPMSSQVNTVKGNRDFCLASCGTSLSPRTKSPLIPQTVLRLILSGSCLYSPRLSLY
jgi:hypothetical protein